MGSKYQTKNYIKRAIEQKKKTMIEQICQGKSKSEHYLTNKRNMQVGKRSKYMNEMTRIQTHHIASARFRMFGVKANYKNRYPDLKCRMCKNEEETQKHVLEECLAIHKDESIKVLNHQLFNEEIDTLTNVAKKLEKIQNLLSDAM